MTSKDWTHPITVSMSDNENQSESNDTSEQPEYESEQSEQTQLSVRGAPEHLRQDIVRAQNARVRPPRFFISFSSFRSLLTITSK